jgi:hypothetical protein
LDHRAVSRVVVLRVKRRLDMFCRFDQDAGIALKFGLCHRAISSPSLVGR